MGCHPKALERLDQTIARCLETNSRTSVDCWLDLRIDYTERATEWDADQWGFDPTRWMAAERAEMERRSEATPR